MSSKQTTKPSIRMQQVGIVSIMVTFLMMIIISLVVLGFSETVRRNSRETLDRQLSTQAYYAAETGVNDAVNFYKTNGLQPGDSTDCTHFIGRMTSAPQPIANMLSETDNVAYTCLLVNDTPKLIETNVNLGDSQVENVHMSSASGYLDFNWTNSAGGSADISSCPNPSDPNDHKEFSDSDTFSMACKYALLRVDIVPMDATPDAQSLADATQTYYLLPTQASSDAGPDFSTASDTGRVFGANCDASACHSKLTGLPGKNYYVRLSTIYNNAPKVWINSDTNVTFSDAQLVIDSTGKAQDELRRIHVVVSLTSNGTVPVNALSSPNTICKRFITPGGSGSADPNYDDSTNPLCQPD